MTRRLLPALLAALLLPAAALAQAQVPFAGLSIDRLAAVEIAAETLDVDQEAGTALFAGEVVVEQGTLRLAADRLRVAYGSAPDGGRGRISRLVADGNVTLTTPQDRAEAAQADYDLDAGVLTLSGGVRLEQGGNLLTSDRLVIDLATGTGRMDGRVRTILRPDGTR